MAREYQDILMRTTIEPFEKKFGVQVTYDNTGSAAQNYAKIRASRGAPGFDVAGELTPPEVILGQKEKLLETISEADVPNLKYVWPNSRTIIPPTGVVHTYQYIALLWNKTHLEKPTSWANYWDPGPAYGDKIKGHLIAFEPANLLIGVRVDHGSQAERRRIGQHAARMGPAEGAEALDRCQRDGIRRRGAIFRE